MTNEGAIRELWLGEVVDSKKPALRRMLIKALGIREQAVNKRVIGVNRTNDAEIITIVKIFENYGVLITPKIKQYINEKKANYGISECEELE